MYIENNDELKNFIPNVMKEVAGEKTLYDKLRPQMMMVECEFDTDIKGEAAIPEGILPMVKLYIASESFRRGMNTLDLILTPNGFGVVSNQNVAPASKERVSELKKSLLATANNALVKVCDALMNATPSAKINELQSLSLFPSLKVIYVFWTKEEPEKLVETYRQVQSMLAAREEMIAEKFVSPQLMDILRERARGKTTVHEATATALLEKVKEAELADVINTREDLIPGPIPKDSFRHIVDFIRKSPFSEIWNSSDTGKAWNEPNYVNEKKKGGYWL